jgi:large subunit ribosomal protein L3
MGKRAHHPKRGSLAFSPRKRASSLVPRIKSWPIESRVRMQGFCGYKAGVTHVMMVDDYKNSLTYGEEVAVAATVIETPPMIACGVRLYGTNGGGLKVISEVWSKDLSRDLARARIMPKKEPQTLEDLEGLLDEGKELRLITHTQPRLASVPKKKPEIMEHRVSGELGDALEYVKNVLGKEIRVSDIFEEGEFVDTISVTKGKGFQGPLKRWGVKHLPRKTRKGHRTAGTLGPWHPAAMMWTVPQGGQMGYHRRTEYNKRILKIGTGEDVNPKGGFLGYGLISGDCVLLKGSIAGPRKRLVRLRPAIRPPHKIPEGKPVLTYISRESKQGA